MRVIVNNYMEDKKDSNVIGVSKHMVDRGKKSVIDMLSILLCVYHCIKLFKNRNKDYLYLSP